MEYLQPCQDYIVSEGEALFTRANKKTVYSGIGVNYLCLLELEAIYQQRFDAHGQLEHEPAICKPQVCCRATCPFSCGVRNDYAKSP